MLPALITVRNIKTGQFLVDQRGYIDDTKEPVVHCNEKQVPVNTDKFEVMLAIVTDADFNIHSPTLPIQP